MNAKSTLKRYRNVLFVLRAPPPAPSHVHASARVCILRMVWKQILENCLKKMLFHVGNSGNGNRRPIYSAFDRLCASEMEKYRQKDRNEWKDERSVRRTSRKRKTRIYIASTEMVVLC